MKNGFYMGYDASTLDEAEILRQARLLLDGGFYAAGYNTLKLGDAERFTKPAALSQQLRSIGFQVGITLSCTMEPQMAAALAAELEAAMVTLVDTQNGDAAERLAGSFAKGVRVAMCVKPDELRWAAELADVAALDVLSENDDYFDITRHRLDRCSNDDIDTALSDANLRAASMRTGGVYQVGNLPWRFDYYRNEAIFLQICMLGCPLILSGDLSRMPARYAALVCDEKLIRMARQGLGRVARYYDPWHVLLVKNAGESVAYALILNRCHGDQPTNILPSDVKWDGRFSLRSWPEGKLEGADLESYEAHVETSDHPQTPCCKLCLLEKR